MTAIIQVRSRGYFFVYMDPVMTRVVGGKTKHMRGKRNTKETYPIPAYQSRQEIVCILANTSAHKLIIDRQSSLRSIFFTGLSSLPAPSLPAFPPSLVRFCPAVVGVSSTEDDFCCSSLGRVD